MPKRSRTPASDGRTQPCNNLNPATSGVFYACYNVANVPVNN